MGWPALFLEGLLEDLACWFKLIEAKLSELVFHFVTDSDPDHFNSRVRRIRRIRAVMMVYPHVRSTLSEFGSARAVGSSVPPWTVVYASDERTAHIHQEPGKQSD
jgi:hypothetical protein